MQKYKIFNLHFKRLMRYNQNEKNYKNYQKFSCLQPKRWGSALIPQPLCTFLHYRAQEWPKFYFINQYLNHALLFRQISDFAPERILLWLFIHPETHPVLSSHRKALIKMQWLKVFDYLWILNYLKKLPDWKLLILLRCPYFHQSSYQIALGQSQTFLKTKSKWREARLTSYCTMKSRLPFWGA